MLTTVLTMLVAPAFAEAPTASPEALAEELSALPSHAERKKRLLGMMAEAGSDELAPLQDALRVVTLLDEAGRVDPVVIKGFLVAGLSPDPAMRKKAIDAAAAFDSPPEVSATAPSPTTSSSTSATSTTPAATTPPSTTAPTPAPTQPVAGTAGTVVVAPQPAAPLRPAPAPTVLRAYKREHLTRGSFTSSSMVVTGNYASMSTTNSWTVYVGGSVPLTYPVFAEMIGDEATLKEVERLKQNATGGAVVSVLGAAALLSTLFMLDDDNSTPEAAVGTLGTVAFLGGLGVWVYNATKADGPVSRHYSVDQADGHIETYNARLRKEKGLTEEDVQDIDLGYAPPRRRGLMIGVTVTGIVGVF